jgi:hypothetical protein
MQAQIITATDSVFKSQCTNTVTYTREYKPTQADARALPSFSWSIKSLPFMNLQFVVVPRRSRDCSFQHIITYLLLGFLMLWEHAICDKNPFLFPLCLLPRAQQFAL